MSESIRTEKDRKIVELEALVVGLSAEVARLSEALDECEERATQMVLALERNNNEGGPK